MAVIQHLVYNYLLILQISFRHTDLKFYYIRLYYKALRDIQKNKINDISRDLRKACSRQSVNTQANTSTY